MDAIQEEIGQIARELWPNEEVSTHLYEPYNLFGPRYHESYEPPPSREEVVIVTTFFRKKTAQSLMHDYTGIRVWIDKVRVFLNYPKGVAGLE